MRKLVAAIDFGTAKMICLVGEKIDNEVKIIAYRQVPSKGIKRGEVINIQNVLDIVGPLIKEIETSTGLIINEVFAGIGDKNIKCYSKTSNIVRKNPDDMISEEEINVMTADIYNLDAKNGEKILQVIPQSYNVDEYMGVSEPVGMVGKEISATYKTFVGKGNARQFIINVLQKSHLKLRKVFLSPLASAKSAITAEDKELGCAIVDIGAGTTSLTIIVNNVVRYSSIIPFGGNSITNDIAQGCGLSVKQAEDLKINQGSCLSSSPSNDTSITITTSSGRETKEISKRFLAKIIEARTAEILEAVDYEIMRIGYKQQLKGGLILTGGTSRLLHITKLAEIITGMEVKTATPFFSVTCDSEQGIDAPEASTAVGLALYGLEQMEYEHFVKPGVIEAVKETAKGIEQEIPYNVDEKREDDEDDTSKIENINPDKKEKKEKKGGIKSILNNLLKNDSMFNNQA